MRRSVAGEIAGRPLGNRETVTRHQTATDIIQQMRRAEKNSRGQSLRLAQQYKGKPQKDIARGVYNFLRHEMQYRKEPTSKQTAKEIRRYVADGFGDCKHYATYAVGVLNACRVPAWFVLVSQRKRSKNPTHAYACCMIGEQVYVIDPCRPQFNSECLYEYKYNLPPKR